MGYIVKCYVWSHDRYDAFDGEYSGIMHDTKEDAEKELKEAEKNNNNAFVDNFFISEV